MAAMEGGGRNGLSVVLLTFLHDALSQSLSNENADISYWIGGEAEQTGQEVLAELLHGHAVLLHYSLQETHQFNHTHTHGEGFKSRATNITGNRRFQ